MSTNRTKSVALAGAAAALPALLFLGAGTAQAEVSVDTTTDALGVTVHIRPVGGSEPSSGWCTYTAAPLYIPAGVQPPLPVHVPFFLQAAQSHDLWFPGVQTGTTWKATVECENGTNSPTQQIRY